jgi:transcriptional regulator with XRE-family HTH domain
MDEPSQLGERLRQAREARGWIQRELARQSGVNVAMINRIEKGEVVNPRLDTLTQLARALRIRVGYLAVGEGPMDTDAEYEPAEGGLVATVVPLGSMTITEDVSL